jgi:hypothetical protein
MHIFQVKHFLLIAATCRLKGPSVQIRLAESTTSGLAIIST